MSSTPAAPVTAPNPIQQGVELYKKRILPAKLDESTNHNGLFFGRHIHAKGLNANTLSPKQISDLLYQATVEDCEKEKPEIKWSVAPKALTKRAEQKGPAKIADVREASTFEQKAHEGDAALKAQKIQDEAKTRCEELVSNFAPINHRRGVIKFDLRATQQAAWRKRIADARDYVKLEKEIATEQRTIYTRLEKEAERV